MRRGEEERRQVKNFVKALSKEERGGVHSFLIPSTSPHLNHSSHSSEQLTHPSPAWQPTSRARTFYRTTGTTRPFSLSARTNHSIVSINLVSTFAGDLLRGGLAAQAHKNVRNKIGSPWQDIKTYSGGPLDSYVPVVQL